MSELFRSLPRHFRNAYNNLVRSKASTVSSVFAVTVTLLLISIFLMTASTLNNFTKNIESGIRVFVRIESTLKDDDITELKKEIEALANVKKVTFSDRDEQFQMFIESDQGGDEYLVFQDDNPLLEAFYVDVRKASEIENVKNACEKLDGVVDASYGGEGAADMLDSFQTIRVGGGIFVLALCVLAIFLVSNTIKINIQSRREEIAIMRNVGASNGFIKAPFLIEGVMIGILGSIIPIVLTIFLYGFLYDLMGGQILTSVFKMQPPMPFVYITSLWIVLIGCLVGLFGSFISVTRYLKWKR